MYVNNSNKICLNQLIIMFELNERERERERERDREREREMFWQNYLDCYKKSSWHWSGVFLYKMPCNQ